MRYFWSLILVLAAVTAGLFTLRVSRERAELTRVSSPAGPMAAAPADAGLPRRPDRPAPPSAGSADPAQPGATPQVIASEAEPPVVGTNTDPQTPAARTADAGEATPAADLSAPPPTTTAAAADDTPIRPAADAGFSLDALLGVVADAADQVAPSAPEPPAGADPVATALPTMPAPADPMMEAALAANTNPPADAADAPEPSPAPAAPATRAGPAFEVRADGSISVEGVGVVPGDGTPQRPFVLDWEVLRSVQREFNPRQGQSEVPAWLKLLDGKRVRIEGNTLLPVVAQTTTELLVMQNPWDGCCLGVPPTPYDAIEVKLASAQRMGNSPTGFGQVEGVFKVDPYIVSGWLLGLYLVEEAAFESAAGISLPEI